MKSIETERLILRKYREDDFTAVHSYSSCAENLPYIRWGPNSEQETRDSINWCIAKANENPCVNYKYVIVLKYNDVLIGNCALALENDDEAEISYILHRDYWKRGYGVELGLALLKFGFEELKLRRIISNCDAENIDSYRLMEKIGMRREAHFIKSKQGSSRLNHEWRDEVHYAILQEEWNG